jgi:hypothetical protein
MINRLISIQVVGCTLCENDGEAEGLSLCVKIGRARIEFNVAWHNRRLG